MNNSVNFLKRINLRAVFNDVSPIVARVISIPNDLEINELHGVFYNRIRIYSANDCLSPVDYEYR